MKGLKLLFGVVWTKGLPLLRFLPGLISGGFILFTLISAFLNKPLEEALRDIALKVLVADLTIKDMVALAVTNSPDYTFASLYAIISSLFILWYWIKLFSILQIKTSGSQAVWGAHAISFVFLAIILFTSHFALTQDFRYVPYEGVKELAFNLQPVLSDINFLGNYIPELGTNETNLEYLDQTLSLNATPQN